MKRILLAIVAAMLLAACPGPTGKVDPWLTARTIILQTQTAVGLADGIFQQWLLSQPAGEKKEEAQAKYLKIKQTVMNGLRLALDGVDVAEQAKKDPEVGKLLEKADAAWRSLQQLLADLLKTPAPPASLPAKAVAGKKPPPKRAGPSYADLKKQLESLPASLFKKRPK